MPNACLPGDTFILDYISAVCGMKMLIKHEMADENDSHFDIVNYDMLLNCNFAIDYNVER